MRRLYALPSSLLIGLVTFAFVTRAGASPHAYFQSNTILRGTVLDANGAVVPRAQITAHNVATGPARAGETDSDGRYQINHANFGQPGRVVGSAAFGQISDTRFPTGDSGSSRQLQFALK